MAGFGGSVKLTGESEYRKALSEITQNLRAVSAEMKAVASSADNMPEDELAKQAGELAKQLDVEKAALAGLKAQLAAMQSEYGKTASSHQQLLDKYETEKRRLELIKANLGENSNEYKAQQKVVADLEQEVSKSSKSMEAQGKAISDLRTKTAQAEVTVNQTAKAMDSLGTETDETTTSVNAAGDGFTVFKGILANLGTQAINAAVSGLKSMGSALVSLGKQAVNSYAEYEQLVGGVETLFGESSDAVLEYANEAYKTAGISANQYMEQVTGFSATLLQGLEGDTARAAEVADIAVKDMADNANKMGTSLSSIQNAYQGFAKDNYTMLDNLKLGYGGTASEMARLLNDSGVLGDSIEVTAQTVKDVPFDKVIEGIHVIQQNIGITGTTTKEAMETISGSTGTMKAAWANLITGMASDTADFGDLINNFVGSAIAVANNMIPRVKQVVKGIGEVITGLLKQLDTLLDDEFIGIISDAISTILQTIATALPRIMEAGSDILRTVIDGISQVVPELTKGLADVAVSIIDSLTEILPLVLEMGTELILNLANGIGEAAPELIPKIVDAVLTMAEALIDNIPTIIEAGMQLILGVAQGIVEALPQIIQKLPELIQGIVDGLIEGLPMIVEGAVQLLMGIVEAIPQIVGALIEALPQIILSIVQFLIESTGAITEAFFKMLFGGFSEGSKEAAAAFNEQIDAMNEYVTALENAKPNILDVTELMSAQGNTVWDLNKDIDEAENGITEILKKAMEEQRGLRDEDIKKIQEYRDQINELEKEKLSIYMSQQQAIYTAIKNNASNLTQEQAATMIANAEKARDETVQAANDMYIQELALIENRKTAGEFLTEAAYQAEVDAATRAYEERKTNAGRFYNASIAEINRYSSEWVAAEQEKWEAVTAKNKEYQDSSLSGLYEFGQKLGLTSDTIKAEYINTYKEMLDEIDTNSAAGFINWLGTVKEGGQKIEGANKEAALAMLESFKDLPTDLEDVGKNTLLGLVSGIDDDIPELKNASEMSAEEIVNTVEQYLGIASPSRVMEEIGQYTMQGLENGITGEHGNLGTAANSTVAVFVDPFKAAYYEMYAAGQQMANGVSYGFTAQEWTLTNNVRNMMSRVVSSVKQQMQIASPSKVFAKIGDFMAQGLGVGFTDEMQDVTKSIQGSMPTSLSKIGISGVKGGYAGVTAAEDMVAAFKQALAEVKIELDDQSVGTFVDKTVTKLVYN